MKPNSQISRQPGSLGKEKSSSRLHSNHPVIDCHFHAPANELKVSGTGSGHKLARPVFVPGFRDLSNEFLGAESTRTYVAEALFFAVIVGVSAWPIVSMVQALAQLMK
jgi:hypothetical protein